MKCMAIKLLPNKHCHKTIKSEQQQQQKFVFPKSLHSYTFSFIKNRSIKPSKSLPSLSVTNLTLPEDTCFNTGASLERWKCKSPRWKSAKISKFLPKDDENFCYKTLESSSYFFNVQGESRTQIPSPVDPDIQELILKTEYSQSSVEGVSGDCKGKKSRKKSKKKIKFSLTTRPPSPATEQIIRVDVTSTVEECCREGNENEQYGMIDDERKELKGNLNRGEREEMYGGGGGGGDDFIVRCRQLALKQRHR